MLIASNVILFSTTNFHRTCANIQLYSFFFFLGHRFIENPRYLRFQNRQCRSEFQYFKAWPKQRRWTVCGLGHGGRGNFCGEKIKPSFGGNIGDKYFKFLGNDQNTHIQSKYGGGYSSCC